MVAALDKRIFKKRFTNSPVAISDAIRKLCRDLAFALPQYVPVRPEADAVHGECFSNVQAKVARDRGVLLYGWTIWEWPHVFIEAEHHAVWQNGTELIDITPTIDGEDRILFLPDPARVYDFETKKRLINVKRSLSKIWAAQQWIDAADRLQRFLEDHSEGDEITFDRRDALPLYQASQQAMAEIILALARDTQPNDRCICTSGRKFRKCCGPLIHLEY